MRREQRLTKSHQFASVLKQGKTRADGLIILKAMPNNLESSRFGFIVSKKVSNKAVIRNRVRRRLREVARVTPIEAGWDIVFIARKQSAEASFSNIRSSMMGVMGRAELLRSG